ncbi:MAG: hypothetical protein CM1200mP26_11710 [Acidimicrobiales bacterium]|nr:MAG: hypothetical protein CM1200mP26_11710 [Acidimicrobiales bacterium]
MLEEIPEVSYDDVGGLDRQKRTDRGCRGVAIPAPGPICRIRLPAPKGILLYGPPGCGKTLIAKAVANSLGAKVSEVSGDDEARATS